MLQTCSRHPNAGRFMATCSGCTRELYDIEQANRAEAAAARAALTAIGTGPDARILSITRIGSAMVVAAAPAGGPFAYTVDTFRLPTPAEIDPDQVDPSGPGDWLLIDQCGDHAHSEVTSMVRDAVAYLAELDIASDLTKATT